VCKSTWIGISFEHIVTVLVGCVFVLIEFAVHEQLLPDVAMVHGRFIVSAWEFGLDGIQDDAVKLLSLAVEVDTVMPLIVFDALLCCRSLSFLLIVQ